MRGSLSLALTAPASAAFAAGRPEYGLGTTPRQVTDTFHRLVERLDAKPVQDVDGTRGHAAGRRP
ncbi:hypothetical protein ACIP3U_15395 [[Kitasatospora] papulosa]|uniref:hypothetical protein n=1 Tax=[Kitasatospora] papulosa TaxID=1464011 RepID=UPI0037FEF901